jgi:hypothetical protein
MDAIFFTDTFLFYAQARTRERMLLRQRNQHGERRGPAGLSAAGAYGLQCECEAALWWAEFDDLLSFRDAVSELGEGWLGPWVV